MSGNLAENIAFIRKNLGHTQEKFGSLLGVTKDTVANWEKGRRTPDYNYLTRISELGSVSIDWIIKGEDSSYISNGIAESITVPQHPQYPICGTVPAGAAEINDLSDWPEMEDAFFDPADHFYLKIDEEYGDSMRPIIKPGDLVLCSLRENVTDNDLCAVRYDNSKGAIKIYEEHGENVVLRSVNPAYDPIRVKRGKITHKYKVVMIKKNS